MLYRIQHRIETLVHHAVMDNGTFETFTELGINLSLWDINWEDLWRQNYWLAEGIIEADHFNDAFGKFSRNISRICSRIALIRQCYLEYLAQPFLIHKNNETFAFINYVRGEKGVGLMFMDDERKALSLLIQNSLIPEEFYFYWNDAVNTTGYSSKLLLMFSALEALVKAAEKKIDYEKLEEIFGEELKVAIWGEKRNSDDALRNRLVHGEYFKGSDSRINFLEEVHKALIKYFNREILKNDLISEDVINPQRHLLGNKMGYRNFIKAKQSDPLNLKKILMDLDEHGIDNPQNYEFLYDASDTLMNSY